MKRIISVLAILQVVTARPQQNRNAKITSYENVNDGRGNFHLAFQTDNGITQQQTGQLKSVNSSTDVTVMRGFFSVIAPDNTFHEVNYISDENGYHSRFSITAPGFSSSNSTSFIKQEGNFPGVADINTEAHKANTNGYQPQAVFMPPMVYASNTTANSTNQTEPEEFPDRIGTPAIITLMGPPG